MVKNFKEVFKNPYKEEEEMEIDLLISQEVEIALKKNQEKVIKAFRRDLIRSLEKYVENVSVQAEREEMEYYYRKGKGILTEQDEEIKTELECERKEKKRMCINLISILNEF